jgi:hypothetical protein
VLAYMRFRGVPAIIIEDKVYSKRNNLVEGANQKLRVDRGDWNLNPLVLEKPLH